MHANDTQPSTDRFQDSAKLTPAEVAEVSENIPKVVDWLDAAAVPQSQEAKADYNQHLVDVCEQVQGALGTSEQPADDARMFLDDLLAACDAVMHALVAGESDKVALAAEPFQWQVAYRLLQDRKGLKTEADKQVQALGYFVALQALLDEPERLIAAVKRLRDELLVIGMPALLDALPTSERAAAR